VLKREAPEHAEASWIYQWNLNSKLPHGLRRTTDAAIAGGNAPDSGSIPARLSPYNFDHKGIE